MDTVVTDENDREKPSQASADVRLDPLTVSTLYAQHSDELRRFLVGVLGDHHLAADVLQLTFTKAIEVGHTARAESLKAWLFSVAYNEAMAIRRRQGVHERAARSVSCNFKPSETAEASLTRIETVQLVQAALEQLPPEQRTVVQLRIYDQMKFVQIADELKLPLGTVLSRMHTALRKLRKVFQGDM